MAAGNPTARPRRPRRQTTTPEFAAMVARCAHRLRERTCAGDLDGLRALASLQRDIDAYLLDAVAALRGAPLYLSWSEIALELDLPLSTVKDRYRKAAGGRQPGGQPSRLR